MKVSYLIIITLILSSSMATTISATLIPSLCKNIARSDPKNINYDFCVSHLKAYSTKTTDTTLEIAQVSFNLTLTKAKEFLSFIHNILQKDRSSDQMGRNVLLHCAKIFDYQVQVDLTAGVNALTKGDYKTAGEKVNSAMLGAWNCEEGFKALGDVPVSLIRRDDEFYELAAVSKGLINLLPVVN